MYTEEQLKAAGLDDFRVFLVNVWAHLALPRPTPVQLDIGHTLQHGPRRLIIQAFRGVGKSWITVSFVLWLLLLNPQLKIMVVSANQQLADDFSRFCKRLIDEMPLLQHLKPRDGQRDSNFSFDVGPANASKDPSVKSAGITGQITGSRADIIVPDDIEVPKNTLTHEQREKLSNLVKEFDAVLKPGGRVIYLGTPQVEETLYRRLEDERGYTTLVWPSEIPSNIDNYRGRLAPFVIRRIEKGLKPGTPLDPDRFNAEDLAERRLSYGRAGYSLQFMLDTSLSDADKHPLRLSDLLVWDCDKDMAPVKLVWCNQKEKQLNLRSVGLDRDGWYSPMWVAPEMAKYTGCVMAIDPSGRGKDETAYAIVRMLHGQLYLVAAGGYRDGYSETTLNSLALKAARYGVNEIAIEENYGGGMFNQLFKPVLAKFSKARILDKDDDHWDGWSRGQKERRILDTLEPLIQGHLLTVDRAVIEEDVKVAEENPKYSLFYQMTRLTADKGSLAHDDRIESLAMACSVWKHVLDRDRDKSIAVQKESDWNKEMARYMEHVITPVTQLNRMGGGNLRFI